MNKNWYRDLQESFLNIDLHEVGIILKQLEEGTEFKVCFLSYACGGEPGRFNFYCRYAGLNSCERKDGENYNYRVKLSNDQRRALIRAINAHTKRLGPNVI